jgi:hypothetical protein
VTITTGGSTLSGTLGGSSNMSAKGTAWAAALATTAHDVQDRRLRRA